MKGLRLENLRGRVLRGPVDECRANSLSYSNGNTEHNDFGIIHVVGTKARDAVALSLAIAGVVAAPLAP